MLSYPFDHKEFIQKRKSIKRQLRERLLSGHIQRKKIKIAIASGSTSNLIADAIEIHLLNLGIDCEIYQSDFNRYYEEIVFDSGGFWSFSPDVVYINATVRNVDSFPLTTDGDQTVNEKLCQEFNKYKEMWETINKRSKAIIIQNNFELPMDRPLGNFSAVHSHGNVKFVLRLNQMFSDYICNKSGIYLNDLNYLSSFYGLSQWFEQSQWYNYKYAYNMNASNMVAKSVASIIQSVQGLSKKCLILDLDNTLWGGVIGDDGIEGIKLGQGDPVGEAYIDFQKFAKKLKERGIILAVCSKNELHIAKQGFDHPESILRVDDFVSFQASWNLKTEAIETVARELNIGLDSIVFIDDNPAERKIVRDNLPGVVVPEIGSNIIDYIYHLDKNNYFETINLVQEDLQKHQTYKENLERAKHLASFENYEAYLTSLGMVATFFPFSEANLDRIVQLINKTNQFNLTNLRLDENEVLSIIRNSEMQTFCVRLKDTFGDNGIVSLVIANVQDDEMSIDLWVMSCRVFKRNLEDAIFDELIKICKNKKIKILKGKYVATKKNAVVSDLFDSLGFAKLNENEWQFKICEYKEIKNKVIEIINL